MRRGGGGRGETQGEGEGRAAASRRSSEYGWNIVTGYEEINQKNRKNVLSPNFHIHVSASDLFPVQG